MTPLVPIAMFGWVFILIGLFMNKTPQWATVIGTIGGFLLLPMYAYDLRFIPVYDKATSVAFGLILGGMFSGQSRRHPFRMTSYDLPMFFWCFVSPLATSLSNGLGLYNGVSDMVGKTLAWGVFYWVGRKYFSNASSLRILTWGIIIGGIVYAPLVLFEVRMSPQLSNIVYGFFPHDFAQHIRYGGYRPIVFMKHGLMVSLWMAVTATVTFWLWRSGQKKRVGGISIALIALLLIAATVLCKSANAWVFLSIGIGGYLYYKKTRSTLLFRILLLVIPIYISLRLMRVISITQLQAFAGKLFDVQRIESLTVRLYEEDLFGVRAMQQSLFGWGGFGRGWPVDPYTGQKLIEYVDAFWVIVISTSGLLGLVSIFGALGIGPWKVLGLYSRSSRRNLTDSRSAYAIDAVVLCLVTSFFLLDSLLNAMASPVYVLSAGALVSYYINEKEPNYAVQISRPIPQ